MKKHFAERDELGYPWWVDELPMFFWIDEEFKEFLYEIEVL